MDYIISINPANGEEVGRTKVSSNEEIEEVVRRAREAFPGWSIKSVEDRKNILRKAGEIFKREKKRLGELLTKEMGKPIEDAIDEAEKAGDEIEYFVDNVDKVLKPNEEKYEEDKVIVRREPYGVVGIIMPWNYPISTSIGAVVPALLTGNTVVYKPSESATLTGVEIVKVFEEAGLPKSVLQIVIGADETGRNLVKSGIDMVAFTGSREAGKDIMKNSSEKLHVLCLELGGKDPFIVDKDADIGLAAKEAVDSAFENCGQVCCSVERVYVVKEVYDDFVKKALEETGKIKVGDGMNSETDMGPLVNRQQFDNFVSHIDDAVKNGAKILAGGKRIGDKGFFYKPTVLVDVNEKMRIMTEETFGPALPIQMVENVEEAIEKANSTRFGLDASIWTKNKERFEEYSRRLQAGTVGINHHGYIKYIFPWGGWKESGLGRLGSIEGIKQFTQTKAIYIRE